jgi:sodium/bile acid cotransporter 7
MITLFRRHWFLFALVGVLMFGLVAPDRLRWFADIKWLHRLIVAMVMFMTTLPVNLQTIRNTISRPGPALLAVAIAYLFIPLLAWPLVQLFSAEIGLGLMVAAVTPTTLATAAVWTRRAEGNEFIPIMVTVITNLTCFVVAPFWLRLTMGSSSQFDLPLGPTMVNLFLLLVVPMLLSQIVRRVGNVARWTLEHRAFLSSLSLCGILSIVLVGAIQCGLRLRAESISPAERAVEFAGMFLAVAAIHIIALAVAWQASHGLGFRRADSIGVAFYGSPKTRMVGLQLALMVGGGLAILPLFVYHFFQLIYDAFVADRWRESAPDAEPMSP